MQDATIEKSFCTTREAATLLGVSVGTVQLWVENGLLEAWKTAGGHRRVLRNSVAQLLHQKPDAALSPPPLTAQPAAGPRRLRILVVEDDLPLLRLYEANLRRWPMAPEVTVTANAVTALLTIGHRRPDLLVTDLHMPNMDGFHMLRVLRTTPDLDQTTIVVVSGLDATDIAACGGIPSGIEVLPKPIPFQRLLAIASDIVTKHHLERRAA